MVKFDDAHWARALEDALRALRLFMEEDMILEDHNEGMGLHSYILGVDWFGDQQGGPYVGFAHHNVASALASLRREAWKCANNRFGIRLHGGETRIPPCKNRAPIRHLDIFLEHLKKLCDELHSQGALYNEQDVSRPYIRSGHGVAILLAHYLFGTDADN